MFGSTGKPRRVYHLAARSDLSLFRLGDVICGRKSTLLASIDEQEKAT
ncbi:hypothetical protein KIP88_44175 [Bradyrhizobium sp. SRL28]|nr:hypothetical protein [Bradyrhizobium sp. SRL28]MBT1517317.1 hypothetical protein [Bradyrhizobium sp. SRL28]